VYTYKTYRGPVLSCNISTIISQTAGYAFPLIITHCLVKNTIYLKTINSIFIKNAYYKKLILSLNFNILEFNFVKSNMDQQDPEKSRFCMYANSKGNTVVGSAETFPDGTTEVRRVLIPKGVDVWLVKVSKPGNKQGIMTQFTCVDKQLLINTTKDLDGKPRSNKPKAPRDTSLSEAEKEEFIKRIGDQVPAEWTSSGSNYKERALENVDYLVSVGLLNKDPSPKEVVAMNYKVNAYYSNK